MIHIYRYFKGYLRILVSGDNNEELLNIAAQNLISIWNTRLVGKRIEANIFISDFIKLRKLKRKKGFKIHILKRYGFPFWAEKNKKRLGFYIGFLLTIIFIEIMSGYIWTIDIVGNNKISEEKITQTLAQIGIKEGTKISKIDTKIEREKLILNCDGIAWASLNIEGSRLTVNIRETKEKSDNKTPTNLKARFDGIITKIDVTQGNCVVKTGDTVKKGDLLVSGILESKDETKFCHSLGSIEAEIIREFSFFAPYKKTIEFETGEVKTKKVLEIFGIRIPLYLGAETKEYNSSTKSNNLKLFGKKIPIKIYSKTFTYIENETYYYSDEEIKAILEKEFEEKLKKEKTEEYTIENSEFVKESSGITYKISIKTRQNIAESEEIITNNQSAE